MYLQGTGFVIACGQGHFDIVKILLDQSTSKNIDLNGRDREGNTGFIAACKRKTTDLVKLFLTHPHCQSLDFNIRNNAGQSGLTLSCEIGSIELVELLLEYAESRGINLPTKTESLNYCTEIKALLEKTWQQPLYKRMKYMTLNS